MATGSLSSARPGSGWARAMFERASIGVSLLLAFGLLARAAAADPAPADIQILQAEFGLFDHGPSAGPRFRAAATVPLVVDQAYGWRLVLKTTRRWVQVEEELTLPAEPGTWGDPDPQVQRKTSADGRTATTRLQLQPVDSVITQSWSVAPGDPKGAYVLRVRVETLPERVFRFEVR